jgi:glycosyltransferase involved in cell wall biosynthesis
MLHGNKVVAVLPAYWAEKTLEMTVKEIPRDIVDEIILVDDASSDNTVQLSSMLGLRTFAHEANLGYGANQKTCYLEALRLNADIIVMLHPDYQYDPRLITAMCGMVASGVYDFVLGSRMVGSGALKGGMPLYKFIANRLLTMFQNVMLWTRLTEYHTGYRAFSRRVLQQLPLLANSDDFVFDNQMLTQALAFGFSIGEISCPTKYFPEASSVNFRRSVVYGLGVLRTSLQYRLWRWGLSHASIFSKRPTLRIGADYYRQSPQPAGFETVREAPSAVQPPTF